MLGCGRDKPAPKLWLVLRRNHDWRDFSTFGRSIDPGDVEPIHGTEVGVLRPQIAADPAQITNKQIPDLAKVPESSNLTRVAATLN